MEPRRRREAILQGAICAGGVPRRGARSGSVGRQCGARRHGVAPGPSRRRRQFLPAEAPGWSVLRDAWLVGFARRHVHHLGRSLHRCPRTGGGAHQDRRWTTGPGERRVLSDSFQRSRSAARPRHDQRAAHHGSGVEAYARDRRFRTRDDPESRHDRRSAADERPDRNRREGVGRNRRQERRARQHAVRGNA
jgi:hypothetical protein